MMTDGAGGAERLSLTYTFNPREITLLARYFRAHQDAISPCLEHFANTLERTVYNTMSIREAEQFYS